MALSKPYAPAQPFTGPHILDLVFILPRPKSLCRQKDPDRLIPLPKRSDRDNLQKRAPRTR
jgi:hypothetical protein